MELCPKIKEIAIITNGLEPNKVINKVKEVLTLPKLGASNKLTIQVSLDGYGVNHEQIRRIPHAFEKATETIRRLQTLQSESPFNLCLTCVVQPSNVDNLVLLAQFGQEIGLPVSFVPIDLRILLANQPIQNTSEEHPLKLSHYHLEKLKYLLSHQLKPYLKPTNVTFWQEYFNIVTGKKRKLPCFLLNYYIGVDVDGTLYLCARDIPALSYGNVLEESPERIWYSPKTRQLRKKVETQLCPFCTSMCDVAFSLRQEFFYYAQFLVKETTGKLLSKLNLRQ